MHILLKNRWFYACLILVASNFTVAALWYKSHHARVPTRVLRVSPEELSTPKDPVVVTFSRPMVPPRELQVARPIPEVTITPPLQVLGLWRTPKTLELQPRSPFPLCTEYELRFASSLLDEDGRPLKGDPIHKFYTQPLKLEGFCQIGLTRDWAATVNVFFNDEVALAELDKKIHFKDEKGAEVPMTRWTRDDTAKVVTFRSDALRREWIEVQVDEGLCGVSGPLGLTRAVKSKVILESGLGLRSIRARMFDANDGRIDLSFPLKVDPKVAKDYLRVEPPATFDVEPWGNGLGLRGDFVPGNLYRVFLRGGLPAEGGRFLPDDVVRSVRIPELPQRVDFVGEGCFLNREGLSTLLIRSVNIDQLLVSIERIFPNNIVHHLHDNDYVGAEILNRRKIPVNASRNRPAFTRLDLKDLVGEEVRGPLEIKIRTPDNYWTRAGKTVTITDLGIHAKISSRGVLVWVLHLSDLSPAGEVSVAVLSKTNQELYSGVTDSRGVVHFEGMPSGADGYDSDEIGDPYVITAFTGSDFSYIPLEEGQLSRAGLDIKGNPYPKTFFEAFAYSERGVIRPGESIHLRALVRRPDGGIPETGMPLSWEIQRPDSRLAASIPVTLSDLGTVEMEWKSETFLPTGRYTALLKIPGDEGETVGDTDFRIEEFLPQTLRVRLEAEERRFSGGTPLKVKVKGEHLFGGAAKGLVAKARLMLSGRTFTHPDWPGMEFRSSTGEFTGSTLRADPQTLDEKGEATFTFDLPSELKARSALEASIVASVFEVSGRACSAWIDREVDPLPFYLGARQPKGHAQIGREWPVEFIALRPDGSKVDLQQVKARLVRTTWNHSLKKDPNSGVYRWISERLETEMKSGAVSCAGGTGIFRFTPEVGGQYELHLKAERGSEETPVETSLSFYTEGGEGDEGSLDIPSRITLTPDKPHYRAGDLARIRVQSPITGMALLTTESDEVHYVETFLLTRSEEVVEVSLGEDLVPHGYVTLTVVRSRNAPGSCGIPVRAYGAVPLLRDPTERGARVEMDLPGEVRPGKSLELNLSVKGEDGNPEEAEVAVALVDAGILALTGFSTPDPLGYFMSQRALGTEAVDIFSMIVPEPDEFLARAPSAPGGGAALAGLLNPIAANRVKSVSIWLGGLRTDPEGRISTVIDAPDFDGELVAMAVVAGRRTVGSIRKELKVRRPLIMKAGLPRFLAPGDRIQVPVSLHNTTGEEILAKVSLAVSDHLQVPSDQSKEESAAVPPNGSTTLWFSLEALEAGKAEITFSCLSSGEETKKTTELPVRPASPPVTRSGCLAVDPGKTASIEPPADLLKGTVDSELVLSPSILPTLEGSLEYLLRYPYGCVEQTSSTLIPWITLRDYLKGIDSVAYTDLEIRDHVDAGVNRLFSMQTGDGGLAFWPGGHKTYVYGTLHAAFVLLEAKAAGYDLPERRFKLLMNFLDGLLGNPETENEKQALTIRAYALSLLAREGRAREGWIETLYQRRAELSPEARAHLAVAAARSRYRLPKPVLEPEAILKEEESSGSELEARDLGGILYSRPRELCIILSALADLGVDREKILPILTNLTERRKGGRYRSTHEDGLFVFTLGKVAKLFPPPEGTIRATLDIPGQAPKSLEVQGRMAMSLPPDVSPIRLSVEEGGTVFAFWKSRGVPLEGTASEDRGMVVRRTFLTPDGDVRPEIPFRQGESVVVKIALKIPRRLENVVVVDALPAGFEIENPNLLTTDGRVEKAKNFHVTRCDMRDDRIILFVDAWGKESSYRYVVRAVTAGRYALPPIGAECMYDSEIRSISGAGAVEVIR